jgi:hypothetical protein
LSFVNGGPSPKAFAPMFYDILVGRKPNTLTEETIENDVVRNQLKLVCRILLRLLPNYNVHCLCILCCALVFLLPWHSGARSRSSNLSDKVHLVSVVTLFSVYYKYLNGFQIASPRPQTFSQEQPALPRFHHIVSSPAEAASPRPFCLGFVNVASPTLLELVCEETWSASGLLCAKFKPHRWLLNRIYWQSCYVKY